MDDEVVEALMDVKEQIERLPGFNDDHGGMHQDNQRGVYVLRDSVLAIFVMYLGAE
jgi:hypothetical protein